METLELIQNIQANLFKFLTVFIIASAASKVILAWINRRFGK